MLISFIVFGCSFLAIFVFLLLKVPDLVKVRETNGVADASYSIKTKIEEGVRKEIKERFENFLHRTLSVLRKIILRIEKTMSGWLHALKKKKGEDK